MAFRKAALSTTNIELEAESAFRWLDAFLGVCCQSNPKMLFEIWFLSWNTYVQAEC